MATTPTQPVPATPPLTPCASGPEMRALVDALKSRRRADEDLRLAVCSFVRACKDEGLKPEQVVVSLKAVVRDATSKPRPEVGSPDERQAEQLMERSVAWCIKEYFRAD